MTQRVTILGCGSSAGVPRVGVGWGACDPANPRNRRRRCSILVERLEPRGTTAVLVDTSPDMREQLLDLDVRHLDAVLLTHDHADHTHGIDDLRPLVIAMRRRMPVYMHPATREIVLTRFGYCFATPPGSDYPPILDERGFAVGEEVRIEGQGGPVAALPFRMVHGSIDAFGFRFGSLAYAPDVSRMPDESVEALRGLEVLLIDALRYTPHPSHFSVSDALRLIETVRPERAILTNLHTDLDYETLRRELPPGVEPAHDGMLIETA